MTAQELRIGNWVMFDNRIFQIDSIAIVFPTLNTDEFGIGVVDWNNIKPVTLTEEWLIKFGFDRRGYTSSNGSKLVLHHKEPMYPNGRIYYNSWCIKNELPQYVHQLQNLYFALTGEELTLKENNNGK
jgi:hypothetical protein